jgi:hypothetical protein
MAETEKGKKIVYVHPYKRADGTRVPAHKRSTPDTSKGAAPRPTTQRTRRRASR